MGSNFSWKVGGWRRGRGGGKFSNVCTLLFLLLLRPSCSKVRVWTHFCVQDIKQCFWNESMQRVFSKRRFWNANIMCYLCRAISVELFLAIPAPARNSRRWLVSISGKTTALLCARREKFSRWRESGWGSEMMRWGGSRCCLFLCTVPPVVLWKFDGNFCGAFNISYIILYN